MLWLEKRLGRDLICKNQDKGNQTMEVIPGVELQKDEVVKIDLDCAP
jgi:hypothetical protein